MAKGLTYNFDTDFKKANELYKFVSNYIIYDMLKYEKIVARSDLCGIEAGADIAFETKKGVCFEYATLFAVMAHSVGLRVRLIYTPGHIWNMYYDTRYNGWISVDCTWKLFNFKVGNYHKSYVIHAEF